MSVIIRPDHYPEEISRVAKALLAAASDPQDVRLETFGDGPVFVVPDEVAEKAQLNPQTDPKQDKAEKPKGSKKRKDQD